jgi:hypothetical protein
MEPIFGSSIVSDQRDIERAQNPANILFRGPGYPLNLLDVSFEKIQKVYSDIFEDQR